MKGQVFDLCGSLCRQGTCARPPPPFCNGMCVPGCQCPWGMVVNEEINACVPMEECPESKLFDSIIKYSKLYSAMPIFISPFPFPLNIEWLYSVYGS